MRTAARLLFSVETPEASRDMHDPIQRHPTRAEQLDILASLVDDQTATGDRLLDLGMGTGYVARLILQRRPDLKITGVDLKPESLAEAADNLAPLGDGHDFVAGDLMRPGDIALPHDAYKIAYSALTFHDLTDPAKRALIAWAAERIVPGGEFLLYDRLLLTEAAAFPLQQSLWRRIEAVHGRGMATTESFAAYRESIGPTNNPAALADYFDWFRSAGLGPAVLHLHGNVALLAGVKPA